VATSTACACTDADYTCDVCYVRAASGQCVLQQTQACQTRYLQQQGCAPWNNYAQMVCWRVDVACDLIRDTTCARRT
jgi:hypothetical protein